MPIRFGELFALAGVQDLINELHNDTTRAFCTAGSRSVRSVHDCLSFAHTLLPALSLFRVGDCSTILCRRDGCRRTDACSADGATLALFEPTSNQEIVP